MILAVASVAVSAQERRVEGILIDRDNEEAVPMATVQLLQTDSTYISGVLTNEKGLFVLQAPANGKYLLKFSSVGYATMVKKVEIADDKDLNMGKVVVGSDAIMLKGVTATAQALKVTVVEDTFVYNSAAYRTPEGSAVEELVKLLPGAQVDDDGNITINGKQVKKIKMDGKEFMNGDTQTALKNLPTSIIEKIKAYEGKSDRSRITGIEDGEDEMTLDFSIKKGMNKGVMGNIDGSYGTRKRYAERLMLGLFRDDFRMMAFGNFNNVNDAGFGGRGGGFGRGRNGLNTTNMAGVNFNYEKTGKLKLDGSVRWNHNTSDQLTKSSSESFVIGNKSFSNSLSQNFSKNKSWNVQMRLEWTPDTMTNIMFRPSFSLSDNDSRGGSVSATFDSDPYERVSDPLAQLEELEKLGIVKNSNSGSSLTYGDTKNVNGWLQINRKLSSKGRNLTLTTSGGFSKTENKNFSTSNVNLAQAGDKYSINRYNLTPSKRWNYDVQLSYSEPIALKTYLQFSYKFAQSYSMSDRVTYDFSTNGTFAQEVPADMLNLYASLGFSNIPEYRDFDRFLFPNYERCEDTSLSRYSEYKTYTHDIEVQFRRVRDNYNFNFGVLLQPQNTNFFQRYMGKENDVNRKVFNVAPTAQFRYYFSKHHQLRFNYRGRTAQPDIANMLDIEDNSDPLNIKIGNPGLKPSFTNSFRFNYNNFLENHFQTINAYGGISFVKNSTTQNVIYDEKTGGRITKAENINGNWNANVGAEYSVALDSLALWNISNSASYSYNHNVGLVSLDRQSSSERNVTKVHNINDRFSISFRNDWLNVEPDASITYTFSRNQLQPNANLNTWAFSYGANINITLPWSMTLASDIHMRSRRGYSDASLNTNELIWNAQIAQNFLKAKNLTVSLQFYDILKKQSNLSRTIDAMSRRDVEYNAINSYAMLHVIYRFNIFPGGRSDDKMGPPMGPNGRPDFRGGEFRQRGNRGGGGGGNFHRPF